MSKRVTIREKNPQRQKVRIYPKTYKKSGKDYFTYIARWKEDGKPREKQFKELSDAEAFKAEKELEFLNQRNKQKLVLSSLTDEQMTEAEEALKMLSGTYNLKQAVSYFLENHRPPEYTITILDGLKIYLDDKERDGVRARTLRGVQGIIKKFAESTGNPKVHEVTPQAIGLYLRGLKAKDGISAAKRKTWNNHRNELSTFFAWASQEDLATSRPWRFNNPAEKIKTFSNERVAEQRPETATTNIETVLKWFTYLINFKEGSLVKMSALSYFAGIRPDEDGEMGKLSKREDELINLKTGIISIPANVAKTKRARVVNISPNLAAWLKAYKGQPIIPVNFSDRYKVARRAFHFQPDEARHSFISYHVALHRALGDTVLQAGNSEAMSHKHYLNLHTQDEGAQFFSIVPDTKKMQAVFSKEIEHHEPRKLRAI